MIKFLEYSPHFDTDFFFVSRYWNKLLDPSLLGLLDYKSRIISSTRINRIRDRDRLITIIKIQFIFHWKIAREHVSK